MAFLKNKSIKYSNLTRGQGKLFLQLDSEDGVDLSRVRASSALLNGGPLPVETYIQGASQLVVGLPILDVPQRFTLDAEDVSQAIFSEVIHPLRASLESKLNTLLKAAEVSEIRDSDVLQGTPSFDVSRIVREGNTDIVNFSFSLTLPEGLEETNIVYRVLGLDGKTTGEFPISMGNARRPSDNYPGYIVRIDSLSARISSDDEGFILWALDEETGRTIAYSVFNSYRTRSLRGRWAIESCSADRDPDYEQWFLESHRAQPAELEMQRKTVIHFENTPVFSIIVPLYKTPISFFRDMANSVLAQTYPYFELILVNASPEDEDLKREISLYEKLDNRIKALTLEDNYGITENTNAGVRASSGDFIAFFDHDDVLEPDALYRYAKAVEHNPETDLIYCDEDHLKDGRYVLPFFKPDWDIDLLCYENYVCHMLAVRKEIVDSFAELPSKIFDGSQDHNMTFLVGERARSVAHIRKVLYHWRIHENSVSGSSGIGQKAYALEAERLAVQGHLDRCGIAAKAVMGKRSPIRCDLEYRFDKHDLVSIIIPNHEALDVLRRCVSSIIDKTSWPNYEVIIVENGSKSSSLFEYYDYLTNTFDEFHVVKCELHNGFDFSKLINSGSSAAKGDYLLLLNNDTEVITSDWIEEMMGLACRPDVGCVGAKLLYPNNTVQHAGVVTAGGEGPFHVNMYLGDSDPGYFETASLPHRMSSVTGACLLTKREVFDKLGGMDEAFPVDYNDVDYCLRAIALGYGVVYQPYSKLYHYESVSRGVAQSQKEIEEFCQSKGKFMSRWADYYSDGDPFYSNLFIRDTPYYKIQ